MLVRRWLALMMLASTPSPRPTRALPGPHAPCMQRRSSLANSLQTNLGATAGGRAPPIVWHWVPVGVPAAQHPGVWPMPHTTPACTLPAEPAAPPHDRAAASMGFCNSKSPPHIMKPQEIKDGLVLHVAALLAAAQ